MNGKRCADCAMRTYYDRKPDSILGRIWKWHISWCPGWGSYIRSLPPEKKEEIIKKYS